MAFVWWKLFAHLGETATYVADAFSSELFAHLGKTATYVAGASSSESEPQDTL